MSDLKNTIRKNNKIKQLRKAAVFDILSRNGIHTLNDLKNKPIPRKGLTPNEIRQLNAIKNDIRTVAGMQDTALKDLYNTLGRYASRHEQSRIYNLLMLNDILSERMLFSTSDEKLNDIYGIGKKSMAVLRKVKESFVRTNHVSFTGYPIPAAGQQMFWSFDI